MYAKAVPNDADKLEGTAGIGLLRGVIYSIEYPNN